jgi:hypothetical protein
MTSAQYSTSSGISRSDSGAIESTEAHKTFVFGPITFTSEFDSGNLFNVEQILSTKPFLSLHYPSNSAIVEFKVWTAADNYGKSYRSKNNNSWFYFDVTGIPGNTVIRIYLKSATHANIYKHDMVS